jgi:hypothetical protein
LNLMDTESCCGWLVLFRLTGEDGSLYSDVLMGQIPTELSPNLSKPALNLPHQDPVLKVRVGLPHSVGDNSSCLAHLIASSPGANCCRHTGWE